jgi:hypothetical protein
MIKIRPTVRALARRTSVHMNGISETSFSYSGVLKTCISLEILIYIFSSSQCHLIYVKSTVKKGKAIRVTGRGARGGPWCCEMSRLPHFLDNQLRDDGEVASLMHRPAGLYAPGRFLYSFLLQAESIPRPLCG